MLDKEIKNLLKPIKIKLYFKKLVNYIFYSLLIGSCTSLLLLIISRFIPITFIWEKVLLTQSICLSLGVIISLLKFPSYNDTANLADSFGLKERVITSLELSEEKGSMAMIQKKDTINSLKNNNIKSKIKLKPPTKVIFLIIFTMILTITVGFIPTKAYNRAKEKEENNKIIEVEKEKITKVQRDIKEDKTLTKEEKEKIDKELIKLKKKLKDMKKNDEIKKEIAALYAV
ncbi:hypothetical protein [Dethiothermospora halolimnae]|uniref:hypothetical protein n=1 Tax=Dethiothermospora halolimnae TaxID=3114390 RepID=UPI003CCBEDB2